MERHFILFNKKSKYFQMLIVTNLIKIPNSNGIEGLVVKLCDKSK